MPSPSSRSEQAAGGGRNRLADRLLQVDLSDPSRVTLLISAISLLVRVAYLPLHWASNQLWLLAANVLGIALYTFFIAIRRHENRHDGIILSYGPEWLLWSSCNAIAFGLHCGFQLYPLLWLPLFVLLFQRLEPQRRLGLVVAPILFYLPLLVPFRGITPLVPLAEDTRWRIAAVNEAVVAAVVVLVAGAALLEHVRARRLAEEREAAQAQLVEDLSHELRTPLATLLTSAQGARAALHNRQRVEESLEWIEDAARAASRLVERLLDLAAAERGQLAPGPTVELARGVGVAVERMRPVAAAREVTLEIVEAQACRELVDAASLEIVVRNLLANAIAHSPPGSAVRLCVGRNDDHLRLEVEDQGDGIAPEHLPRIFDRLWRADPARSRGEGRYGLGLPLAARHAELLGAHIEVRSELGGGSTFTVVFDRA